MTPPEATTSPPPSSAQSPRAPIWRTAFGCLVIVVLVIPLALFVINAVVGGLMLRREARDRGLHDTCVATCARVQTECLAPCAAAPACTAPCRASGDACRARCPSP